MKTCLLGNELQVSTLGLGRIGMGAAYAPAADTHDMIKLIWRRQGRPLRAV